VLLNGDEEFGGNMRRCPSSNSENRAKLENLGVADRGEGAELRYVEVDQFATIIKPLTPAMYPVANITIL